MAQVALSANDFVEVRVIKAGDDCNLYAYDPNVQGLRLDGVYRPDQTAPVDQAVVPDTSPDGDSDLVMLLIRHRAIFPGCVVSARPIALAQIDHDAHKEHLVVAVPAADEAMAEVDSIETLSDEMRQALMTFVRAGLGEATGCTVIWANGERAREVIYQARQSARLERARSRKGGAASPAWRPLGYRVQGARRASDAEPHTEAEQAYNQLPYRFQKYVDDYLAHNERILFGVRRPAMQSAVRRGWRSGETLQEGIFFITDQQVVMVSEIIPPNQSNIRYGYVVHSGIPERVQSARVQSASGHAFLEVIWHAIGGNQRVAWEFPAEAKDELAEAVEILRRWQPRQEETRLRRRYGPESVESRLHDPAANDPADAMPIIGRLTEALEAERWSSERVLAQALLPAWADSHKVARCFAVTDHRALLVPDPAVNHRAKPSAFSLDRITTVELKSSILESWLALNVASPDGIQRTVIVFPYTVAEFRACFLALRQQLTAVPTPLVRLPSP